MSGSLSGRTICPFPVADGPRIACSGPQTAEAVRAAGGRVDLVPAEHNAAALVADLVDAGVGKGTRILFPCADLALTIVQDRLGAEGADVTRLVVYRTVAAESMDREVTDGVDAIVFLSPSAAAAFTALGGDLKAAPVVAIGPTTAAAIARQGVRAEVAPTSDRAGILRLLEEREWK